MPGELVPGASPAWQAALELIDHDVYHSAEYAAIDARQAGGEPVAFVYRDGAAAFFVPLVLRRIPGTTWQDASSGYGYPGPISTCPGKDGSRFCDDAITAMTATLASAGIVSCFLRLHPLLPAPLETLRRHGVLVEHGPTVAVDLTQTPEALWRGIRANHRRQITSATSGGLTVDIDEWSQLDAFMDAYDDTMRHVRAAPSYFFGRGYFEALRGELGSSTHLITARMAGETVGGALVFEHRGIVQYHLGATMTEHRDRQPMKTVLYRTMEWARQRGDRVLHLGGGLGGRTDSLFHFKAGFSDLRFPFHTWRVVIDPDAYRKLTPASSTGGDPLFFPAYRRPAG